MNILNQISEIEKLDKNKVRVSLESLSLQCQQAWQEVKKVKIPASYKKASNILINGMGGSGLGGHVIQTLFSDRLKVPLQVVNSYNLPAYLSEKTLYIIVSYSGTTEEPISTGREAIKKRAKILGITTGGKLKQFLIRNNIPGYLFDPKHNPCGEPRMGQGYMLMGQFGLLKKCGMINITDQEIEKAIEAVGQAKKKFGLVNPLPKNPAKKIAQACKNKIPILIGSEFLVANTHTFANQINENGKNFAAYFVIPELNHHLMEGLKNPQFNKKFLIFVFLESDLYHSRVRIRHKITKKVIQKHGIKVVGYKSRAKTKIEQVFEILSLGGYVSFYLAMLYQIDPSFIPWVDYFKKELAIYK